ncbi:hypothetical protein HU200_013869 [Digitaria exilis]|uniref:Uncharacterized protein n=1 Tax=Digitaria exilis TaxID=1010633 RepID=A0A835FCJ6_9POAL|nr:hypothetical protein HU200_013869 [Digitaria exilis]
MSAAAVLREDDRGIPRSLPLFAALVDAEARRYAAAASQPAKTSLVRAFRGGAAPKLPIRAFLERIHLQIRSGEAARGLVRIDGTCFVLAGIYLTRFICSSAGMEAGILVEPATAHRLVAVALFLGAKFGGHPPRRWTAVFEACSGGAIRAAEMADLEGRFLRAIGFRLFVNGERFEWFCKAMERGPQAPNSGGGDCACKKRNADAATVEEDKRRRVRACLPPHAVVSH